MSPYEPLRSPSMTREEMVDTARALAVRPGRPCYPNAHRYVDINALSDPERLVCYRCGYRRPR